jgi:hypothetical protein
LFNISSDFDIEENAGAWLLSVDGKPIMDPSGEFPIRHHNKKLVEALSEEIQSFGDISINDKGAITPIYFSLYALLSDALKIKWKDHFLDNLEHYIFSDMTFVTSAGPERIDQFNSSAPILQALRDITSDPDKIVFRIAHSAYFEAYSFMEPNEVFEMLMEEAEGDEKTIREIVTRENLKETDFFQSLISCLENMFDEECAALHGLVAISGGTNFFSAFSLILRKISKDKYATSVLSSHNTRHGIQGDVDRNQYRSDYSAKISEASIALSFIELCTDPILKNITEGESSLSEFKETFSLDVKRSKGDPKYQIVKEEKIETSSLKTIAGMLNARGGTLFVGVGDDTKILGLENELAQLHRSSLDSYLLYLKDKVAVRLGKETFASIEITTPLVDGKKIIKIDVIQSKTPIFLKPNDDFYVRTTPATEKLSGKEQLEYVRSHFG